MKKRVLLLILTIFLQIEFSSAGVSRKKSSFVPQPRQENEPSQMWSKTDFDHTRHFIILREEESGWVVESFEKAPGRLQSLEWHGVFSERESALQFIQGKRPIAGKRMTGFAYQGVERNLPNPPGSVTEVQKASIWKATEQWSWDWEKKYAEWVINTVDKDFFVKYQIKTDCADVAFALKWIFSRINALPMGNRLAGSGDLFTNESVKSSWANLPTDPDWFKDQRFLTALDYLLENTFTQTLLSDSYPVEISPTTFMPGVHHLDLAPGRHHTRFVNQLDTVHGLPLKLVASNDPRIVRELMQGGFWDSTPHKEGEGGFLRIRWTRIDSSGATLILPENMPSFSREQFDPKFQGSEPDFATAVLKRLDPAHLDWVSRYQDGMQYLKDQLEFRRTTVEDGFKACQTEDCSEGTTGFENWSTPSRDARIGDTLLQLDMLVNSQGTQELVTLWDADLNSDFISFDGGVTHYQLKHVRATWNLQAPSSDPRDPIEERWALEGSSFAHRLQKDLLRGLVKRAEKIDSHQKDCPGKHCAVGSSNWLAAETFSEDITLLRKPEKTMGYCTEFSETDCARLKFAIRSEKLNWRGERLTFNELNQRIAGFVADPSYPLASRWGNPLSGFRFVSVPETMTEGVHFQMSQEGIGAIVSGGSAGLKDYVNDRDILLPHPESNTSVEFDSLNNLVGYFDYYTSIFHIQSLVGTLDWATPISCNGYSCVSLVLPGIWVSTEGNQSFVFDARDGVSVSKRGPFDFDKDKVRGDLSGVFYSFNGSDLEKVFDLRTPIGVSPKEVDVKVPGGPFYLYNEGGDYYFGYWIDRNSDVFYLAIPKTGGAAVGLAEDAQLISPDSKWGVFRNKIYKMGSGLQLGAEVDTITEFVERCPSDFGSPYFAYVDQAKKPQFVKFDSQGKHSITLLGDETGIWRQCGKYAVFVTPSGHRLRDFERPNLLLEAEQIQFDMKRDMASVQLMNGKYLELFDLRSSWSLPVLTFPSGSLYDSWGWGPYEPVGRAYMDWMDPLLFWYGRSK